MRRPWISILVFLLILSACSPRQQDPNVVINGSFPSLSGSLIVLEELEPRQTVVLDSTYADPSGRFQFHVFVAQPGFYVLRSGDDHTLVLQIDPEQEVEVRGEEDFTVGERSVSGSPGSNYILEFDQFMAKQRMRIDSIGKVYEAIKGDPDFSRKKEKLDSIYSSLVQTHRKYVLEFIAEHPSSLVNLLMINRRMGKTIVFDEKKDYPLFYRVDSLLQQHHPENKHAQDHKNRVRELKGEIFDDYVMEEKLRSGKKAPDVVLPDTSGNPISLKSYAGKTVLLYFWAGWDGQSRKDNRVLESIYPTLKEKNIEIIGISLDENEVVWKGAIRLDGLSWPQVSELKGFYSQIKKDYHIPDDLPFYYIIGPDQKIRYKHAALDSILVRLN